MGFRVLCLNISIPNSAPNEPRNPSVNNLDSEILLPPLMAHSLSRPKKIREIMFIPISIIRKVWST